MKNVEEVYIPVSRVFGISQKFFFCTVKLYVSDKEHDSHFKPSHAHNKGPYFICIDLGIMLTCFCRA